MLTVLKLKKGPISSYNRLAWGRMSRQVQKPTYVKIDRQGYQKVRLKASDKLEAPIKQQVYWLGATIMWALGASMGIPARNVGISARS